MENLPQGSITRLAFKKAWTIVWQFLSYLKAFRNVAGNTRLADRLLIFCYMYQLLALEWFQFFRVSPSSWCFKLGFVILMWHSLDLPYNYWYELGLTKNLASRHEASMTGASAQFAMLSRGVEVKEQHRVPWPEMALGRGDPKPRRADYTTWKSYNATSQRLVWKCWENAWDRLKVAGFRLCRERIWVFILL